MPHALEVEEIECDIDEDFDNEKFTGKMINNSFINKLKDFSSFNPSGNKGREKISNSQHIQRSSEEVAGGSGQPVSSESKRSGSIVLISGRGQDLVPPESIKKLDIVVESPANHFIESSSPL